MDRAAADELAFQISQESEKTYGVEVFRRQKKALQRTILSEMQEGGASLWCEKQRLFYEKIGLPGIIGQSIH